MGEGDPRHAHAPGRSLTHLARTSAGLLGVHRLQRWPVLRPIWRHLLALPGVHIGKLCSCALPGHPAATDTKRLHACMNSSSSSNQTTNSPTCQASTGSHRRLAAQGQGRHRRLARHLQPTRCRQRRRSATRSISRRPASRCSRCLVAPASSPSALALMPQQHAGEADLWAGWPGWLCISGPVFACQGVC